jgi:hypothetical protein
MMMTTTRTTTITMEGLFLYRITNGNVKQKDGTFKILAALVQMKTQLERNSCHLQYSTGGCDSLHHKTEKVGEKIKTQAEMVTHCQSCADGLGACSNVALILSYMNTN